MLQNLSGWHALVILAIVLLVFGSSKLPQLAKGVGQSMRILKDEIHDGPEGSAVRPVPPTVVDGINTDIVQDRAVVAPVSTDPVTGLRAS